MYDMSAFMRLMQGGLAAEPFRGLGLSGEEAQRAAAAMLPAFMMGFARRSAAPGGEDALKAMMNAWLPGAAAPRPADGGQAALAALFGSDAMAREIARQASLMTGIGTDILKAAMPAMAEMFLAGAARMQDASLDAFLPPKRPPPPPDPVKTFTDTMAATTRSMTEMMTAAMAQGFGQAPRQPGGQGAGQAAAPQGPASGGKADEDLAVSGLRAVTRALEDGRRAQDEYLMAMERLFDSFYGKTPSR